MQTIDIAQAIKENSTSVSQNLDSSVLEGLLELSRIKNTIPVGGSLDDLYAGTILIVPVNVTGDNPSSILGGNQFVIIQVNPGDPAYCGQYAFGFGSNKIAFRSRSGGTKWTSWQLI